MRRYRKQGGVLRKKPEPNPYEVAIKRLGNLKNRRLWEQGMEKEYFTLLTDILREYLERRFDINAESNIKTGIDIPASHKTPDNKKGGGI